MLFINWTIKDVFPTFWLPNNTNRNLKILFPKKNFTCRIVDLLFCEFVIQLLSKVIQNHLEIKCFSILKEKDSVNSDNRRHCQPIQQRQKIMTVLLKQINKLSPDDILKKKNHLCAEDTLENRVHQDEAHSSKTMLRPFK